MKSCCSFVLALLFCVAARGAVDMRPADGLDGWLDAGLGRYDPVPLGGATATTFPGVDGTVWQVTAGGTNMYSTIDGCRFVFTDLPGDGEVRVRTRVDLSLANIDDKGRGGVMLRDSLRPDAKTAIMYRFRNVVPTTEPELQIRAQRRLSTGWDMNSRGWIGRSVTDAQASNEWAWVRLVRQGNSIYYHFTTNDAPAATDWTQYAVNAEVSLGESCMAGFFAGRYYTSSSDPLTITRLFTGAAVTPFVVATNGADGIDVSWVEKPRHLVTDYTPASYTIARDTSHAGAFSEVLATGLTGTTFTDMTARPGVKYYYKVTCVDAEETVERIGVSGAAVREMANAAATWPSGWWWEERCNYAPNLVLSNGVQTTTLQPGDVYNNVRESFKMVFRAFYVPEQDETRYFAVRALSQATLTVDGVELGSTILTQLPSDRNSLHVFGPVRMFKGRPTELRVNYSRAAINSANGRTAFLVLQWATSADGAFETIPVERLAPLPAEWTCGALGSPERFPFAVCDATTSNLLVSAGGSDAVGEHGTFLARAEQPAAEWMTTFAVPATGSAGLMQRASWADDAATAACLVSADGFLLVGRQTNGAERVASLPEAIAPAAGTEIVLKMTPSPTDGTVAFSYRAANASEWTSLGTVAYEATSVMPGLAVMGGGSGDAATVAFKGTSRTMLAAPTPAEADTAFSGRTAASARATVLGAGTEMLISQTAISSGTRQALLRFDTHGLANVGSATLRLYMISHVMVTNLPEIVQVTRVADTTWNEATTTWDNFETTTPLPFAFLDHGDYGTPDARLVAEFTAPYGPGFVEVDVTEAVRASARQGGKLSLALNTMLGKYDTQLRFASKEYAGQPFDTTPKIVCSGAGALGLVANPGAKAGEIALRWTFRDVAERYDLWRAANGGARTRIATGLWGYNYVDAGLSTGISYTYWIVPAGCDDPDFASAETATSTCDAQSRTSLLPIADTYLSASKEQNGKNGNQTTLIVKSSFPTYAQSTNTVTLYAQREALLLFDTDGLADACDIRLKLTHTSGDNVSGGEPKTFEVMYFNIEPIDIGDWRAVENTCTWMNCPTGGMWFLRSPLKSQYQAKWPDQRHVVRDNPKGWYPNTQEIDVTEMVRAAAKQYRYMTLVIYRIDDNSGNNCSFASKENGTDSYRPRLYASFAGTPPAEETIEAGPRPLSGRIVAHGDTYIDENAKNSVLYAAASFNLKSGNDICREQLYRFDVRGLDHVAEASVRFAVNPYDSRIGSKGKGIGAVAYDISYAVGEWDETIMTWNTAPPGINRKHATTTVREPNELGRVFIPRPSQGSNATGAYLVEYTCTESVRRAARAGHDLVIKLEADDLQRSTSGEYMSVVSSKYSEERVRPTLCYAPAASVDELGLSVTVAETNRTAAISWQALPGAIGYTLVRTDPKGKSVTVADNTSETSVVDADLGNLDNWSYSYVLTVHFADGTSAAAPAKTVKVANTVFRRVLADGYAQSGVWNSTTQVNDLDLDATHAAETQMMIKRDNVSTSSLTREMFIRVDLTDVPEGFTTAELSLRLAGTNTDKNFNLVCETFEDTGWTESGEGALTWRNSGLSLDYSSAAPATRGPNEAGNRVNVATLEVGDEARFWVTDLVKAARAAGKETLLFHVYSDMIGNKKNINFYAREISEIMLQPRMVYGIEKRPIFGTVLIFR